MPNDQPSARVNGVGGNAADPTVGTASWGARTGGRLRLRDRARLAGQYLLEARLLPGETLSRFGRVATRAGPVATDAPPVSPIASAAIDLCREATTNRPWLYGHCVRSFHFGQLFALRDRIDFDPEVLWVAALLHDIALADAAANTGFEPACFAVRGANRARRLADRFEWPEARGRQLEEAISLHINVRVPIKRSAEGHLLNLGSGLDVAGLRYRRISGTALRGVLERDPPGDFPVVIAGVWNTEARRSPGCRAAFLRGSGFGMLIRTSPLARGAGRDSTPPRRT